MVIDHAQREEVGAAQDEVIENGEWQTVPSGLAVLSDVVKPLLEELDEPMLSMTLSLPGDEEPLGQGWEIRERLEHQLDLVIDAGACSIEMTTVIDLTGAEPKLIRRGKGDLRPFGLNED